MEDVNSSRPASEVFFRVETAEQARLLSDPKSADFIQPFLGKACSVAGAAQELGCSIQVMHYRVRQLLQAGLLKITREEKRTGRPVKYYRAVSHAFFIPDDLTPYADLEERLRVDFQPAFQKLIRGLAEGVRREGRTGHCKYRNAQGDICSYGCVERVDDQAIEFNLEYPFRSPNMDRRGDINLTEDEARQLTHELNDLFDHYLELSRDASKGRKAFSFLYALVVSPNAST